MKEQTDTPTCLSKQYMPVAKTKIAHLQCNGHQEVGRLLAKDGRLCLVSPVGSVIWLDQEAGAAMEIAASLVRAGELIDAASLRDTNTHNSEVN